MKLKGIDLIGEYTIKYFDDYLEILDENNNRIYYENSYDYWTKREYDECNNEIYFENSDKYWFRKEFDKNNNQIYFEDSDRFWIKREFDKNNNEIYYENSRGIIIGNRPKEVKQYTVAELEKLLNQKIEIIAES
ncbi:MAG: hypothetical protein KQ78_01764 [Candidatus Izimaplasma bacterium HR2]|nr:MAG: hypothetical protein KQ78_01764 [Candidatus Izimaplasma bacterium HR2]